MSKQITHAPKREDLTLDDIEHEVSRLEGRIRFIENLEMDAAIGELRERVGRDSLCGIPHRVDELENRLSELRARLQRGPAPPWAADDRARGIVAVAFPTAVEMLVARMRDASIPIHERMPAAGTLMELGQRFGEPASADMFGDVFAMLAEVMRDDSAPIRAREECAAMLIKAGAQVWYGQTGS